jgi:hypothetical protein
MKSELLILLIVVLVVVYSMNSSGYELEAPAPAPAPAPVSNYELIDTCTYGSITLYASIDNAGLSSGMNNAGLSSGMTTDPTGMIYVIREYDSNKIYTIDNSGKMTVLFDISSLGVNLYASTYWHGHTGFEYDYVRDIMYFKGWPQGVQLGLSYLSQINIYCIYNLKTNPTLQFISDNAGESIMGVNTESGNMFFMTVGADLYKYDSTQRTVTNVFKNVISSDQNGNFIYRIPSGLKFEDTFDLGVDQFDNVYYRHGNIVYKNETILYSSPNSFLRMNVDKTGKLYYIGLDVSPTASGLALISLENGNKTNIQFITDGSNYYFPNLIGRFSSVRPDPNGTFIYMASELRGEIYRVDINCNGAGPVGPVGPCVGGDVRTIWGNSESSLYSLISLDGLGNEVSVLDSQGIITFDNYGGNIIKKTNIGPTNYTSNVDTPYTPRLLCYGNDGVKIVLDDRGVLWMVMPDSSWNSNYIDLPNFTFIDMCHDFGDRIYLLASNGVICTITYNSDGLVSYNIFGSDTSVVSKYITIIPDGTIYVADMTSVYSIQPLFDTQGN